jgi:hypothetical protein
MMPHDRLPPACWAPGELVCLFANLLWGMSLVRTQHGGVNRLYLLRGRCSAELLPLPDETTIGPQYYVGCEVGVTRFAQVFFDHVAHGNATVVVHRWSHLLL